MRKIEYITAKKEQQTGRLTIHLPAALFWFKKDQ